MRGKFSELCLAHGEHECCVSLVVTLRSSGKHGDQGLFFLYFIHEVVRLEGLSLVAH